MRNVILLVLALGGCSENWRAHQWGGTMVVDLPCGEKLFDLTWEYNDFWYATKPMREGDEAETYTFRTKTPSGFHEGTVIIKECTTK